jgi:hypothetical protein
VARNGALGQHFEHYREVAAGILLMYEGRSDSRAVNLAMEKLAAVLPRSETKNLPNWTISASSERIREKVALWSAATSSHSKASGRPRINEARILEAKGELEIPP